MRNKGLNFKGKTLFRLRYVKIALKTSPVLKTKPVWKPCIHFRI